MPHPLDYHKPDEDDQFWRVAARHPLARLLAWIISIAGAALWFLLAWDAWAPTSPR